MYRDWHNRGTTLVEMLVVLALSTLLMSALMSVFWSGRNIFAQQMAHIEAQYSVRNSHQQIGEDVRRASTVEIMDNGAQISLGIMPGEMLRYYQYHNQLFRESITSRGTVRLPIAENISAVHFGGDARLVTINIDASVAGQIYRLSTSVHPRLAD